MRALIAILVAALLPLFARAGVVDISHFPASGERVPSGTVLADQWRPIGILFSARTPGLDAIQPVAVSWGDPNYLTLFFSPDLYGAVAVFDFVEPGTTMPMDIHRFALVPYFNVGESAQLVGLDEHDSVVAQDEVVNTPEGGIPMAIRGTFRRVEWRTQGDPGIAAFDLVFDVCAPTPVPGCITATKASLSLDEKKLGKERLAAKLAGFGEATSRTDLGDPVAGTTSYEACLYDGLDRLVGGLTIARAGGTCGARKKNCWKAKGRGGWSYKDPAAASDGVRAMLAVSGAAGKGLWTLQAGNNPKKGWFTLRRLMSASLQGATRARLQVVTSDAACFDAVLGTVKAADGVRFKARAR